MKFFGITLDPNSNIVNLTVESGTVLPTLNVGGMYFQTSGAAGLYVYDGTTWQRSAFSTASNTFTTPQTFTDINVNTITINGQPGVAKPVWQKIITTYTAVANDHIFADSSAGSFTITLPLTPLNGDTVTFVDPTGSWSASNITVNGNGANIMGAADLLLNVNYQTFQLTYTSLYSQWQITTS